MIYLRFVKNNKISKARNLNYERKKFKSESIIKKLMTKATILYFCMFQTMVDGDDGDDQQF